MARTPNVIRYLASIPPAKVALWCYLIWYLVTVVNHFDPSPAIWFNSLGISAVVGLALCLSVDRTGERQSYRWQTLRLFLIPFCVSSFASLIKGHGFVLVVPPSLSELAMSLGGCVVFILLVASTRYFSHQHQ